MSNLSSYIENIKKYVKENSLNELETIRYVYLDLGQRLSFNLSFSFGNTKTKRKIYDRGQNYEALEEDFKSNIAICNSMSYMLEKILKELGTDIKTAVSQLDERHCAHMYNIITMQSGEMYTVDLQEDLENIQSHSFTRNFGVSLEKNKLPAITRFNIEKADKKIGYISDEFYYADEYLYLMKSISESFKSLNEKAKFVLENLDVYESPNMKYAERKWHHEKLLKEIFSEDELKRIHQINCYRETSKGKEYQNCIVVEASGLTDIYLFSTEANKYNKVSMEEFAKEKENGLVNMEGIVGLKKFLRERKEQTER